MAQQGSIVVGTDGSPTADRAVERAGELASALGVTLHVVSGYRMGSNGMWMAAAAGFDVVPEVADEGVARTRSEECVARAQGRLAELGVDSQTHVLCGDAAEALMTIADGEGAQMIVVGNRGMSGARRMLGSVPNRVSHNARCGVLIVPTS